MGEFPEFNPNVNSPCLKGSETQNNFAKNLFEAGYNPICLFYRSDMPSRSDFSCANETDSTVLILACENEFEAIK